MAVDRRAKPYYYLSCAHVDDDQAEENEEAMKQRSREDAARSLISTLCHTEGKSSLEDVLTRKPQPLKPLNIATVGALKEFCQSFPQCFVVRESSEGSELEVTTDMNLCSTHAKKTGSCPEDGECGFLHLCRFFMLTGRCDCGTTQHLRRLYGHQLHSDHNVSVLRKFLMEHLTMKQVQTLVRRLHARTEQTRPIVCRFYNSPTGCFKGANCMLLHLCKRFTLGDCKYGADCLRSHDLMEPTVKAILEKYAIPPDVFLTVMKDTSPNLKIVRMPQPLTQCTPSAVSSSGAFPPPVGRPVDVSVRSDERDQPSGGQTSRDAASTADATENTSAYCTVFSRRRGHQLAGEADQQKRSTHESCDMREEGGVQADPVSMNPFSYMRVSDPHTEADSIKSEATVSREEREAAVEERCAAPGGGSEDLPPTSSAGAAPSACKARYASKKAEDVLFGQSHDSSFIPLKQADRPLGVKLACGRPVASVLPQTKIKPELAISRKVDIPLDVELSGKKGGDSIVKKEWSAKGGNEEGRACPVLPYSEKPSQCLPSSAALSQAESLQDIISNLINNVKKLHAKNPGPEHHVMNYLSELAQPDKLAKEMKAAESRASQDRTGASLQQGADYRSEGELSDSDQEEGDPSRNAVQEQVLFDYNHRPTVDLIGDMLKSRENSPCKETPSQRTAESSSAIHKRKSLRRKDSNGDRDLEEVSSTNSALSDIMSSEEDPQDSDNCKTRKDLEAVDKTLKDSPNMLKAGQGVDVKPVQSPHSSKELQPQGGKSVGSDQQTQQDANIGSKKKTAPEPVPTNSTSSGGAVTTSTSSDAVKRSSEGSTVCHDQSLSEKSKSPLQSGSLPKRTSPCSRSSSHGTSFPDKQSSDSRPSGSSNQRRSPCEGTSSQSKRSPSGVRKPSPGRGKSSPASRSSPGNRNPSEGKRKSPAKRKSPETRSSNPENVAAANTRSAPENKPEKSGRHCSDNNRSSENRRSSDRRSSDRNRSHEEKKLAPNPGRSLVNHRKSPVSSRNCLSDSRGHTSYHRERSPEYQRISRSPHHRRFSPSTKLLDKEHHYSHSPSHYQHGHRRSDRSDRASPSFHQRNTGSRDEDWHERERRIRDAEEHRFRSREKDHVRKERHRSRSREAERTPRGMDDFRPRGGSHERRPRSVGRSSRHFDHSCKSRNEIHREHHDNFDRRQAHSPERERDRLHRECRMARDSGSPSRTRGRPVSRAHGSCGEVGHRQEFDRTEDRVERRAMPHRSGSHGDRDRWPASEYSGGVRCSRDREEFFHDERFTDNNFAEESHVEEDLCHPPDSEVWNQDDRSYDRSADRMHGARDGRLRNRLGPSLRHFENEHMESSLPDDRHKEWDSPGAKDGYRSPYQEKHCLSDEIHDISGEDPMHREQAGSPFDRERDWHEDSANRHGPRGKISSSCRFASHEEWERACAPRSGARDMDGPERESEVILKYSSQSEEEEKLMVSPYREHRRSDWSRPGTPLRSGSPRPHSPRSPSTGMWQDRGRGREWPGLRHSPPPADFREVGSRHSLRHGEREREELAAGQEGLSLREQIDDFLDEARHSSSRGPSPFKDVDRNYHTADIRAAKDAEMDGRPSLRGGYCDRGPEQYRRFHSQERSESAYHRGAPKRRLECSDKHTMEHKRGRRGSEGREHPSGGQRFWHRDSPHRDGNGEGSYGRGWADEESHSPESQSHQYHDPCSRRRGHQQEEGFQRRSRPHGQNHSSQCDRNAHKYNRDRSGLKIQRFFDGNRHTVEEDGAPYVDEGQGYLDDEHQPPSWQLEAHTDGDYYGEHFEDRPYEEGLSREELYHEEDFEVDCGDYLEDVGDMIEHQKARARGSDLRNLLKTRSRHHFSEAENEHIQIQVSRDERHMIRKSYGNDGGRKVIMADHR